MSSFKRKIRKIEKLEVESKELNQKLERALKGWDERNKEKVLLEEPYQKKCFEK